MRVTAALAGMPACAEPPRALSLRWAGWRPRRAAIPGLAPPCGVPKLDRALVAGVSGRCEPVVSLALSTMGGAGGGVVRVRDVRAGDGARVAVLSLVGLQGARDRRAAPWACCAAPAGIAPGAAARRSCFPGRGEPAAPQGAVALVLCDPRNAPRLAPTARRPTVDLSRPAPRRPKGQPG